MKYQKNDFFRVSVPSAYLFISTLCLGLLSYINGSSSISNCLYSISVIFSWLIIQKILRESSFGLKVFIVITWSLFFIIFYITDFTNLRITRFDSLFLYSNGDEMRYLESLQMQALEVSYGKFDVSFFYQIYFSLLNFITNKGNLLANFYAFNIALLIVANYLIAKSAERLTTEKICLPIFLLLNTIPEGYFWALTLYKEVLCYFLISLVFYLFSKKRYMAFLSALGSLILFRTSFILNAFTEFLFLRKKGNIIGKTAIFVTSFFVILLFFSNFYEYTNLFMNANRLDWLIKRYNLDFLNNYPLLFYICMPLLFVLSIFAGLIFVLHQPTPFFLLSDPYNEYLYPWYDLIVSSIIIFPFISLYCFKCFRSLITSLRHDIYFRFCVTYFFGILLSALFLTLRHRFVCMPVIMVGALIFWFELKRGKFKYSMLNYIYSFLFTLISLYLVAFIKR